MAILRIEPTQPYHIAEVNFREWELNEYGKEDYREALMKSVKASVEALTYKINGKIVLLVGHAPRSIFTGSGFAWMLATPEAEEHWFLLAKHSKKIVAALCSLYPELFVATYAGNARAIRLLTWLGFKKHSQSGNNLTMVRG